MNFTCSICSELLTQIDNIFSTLCGHIFHYSCLSKWISRSTTCPQCRSSITKDRIQRLYFTFVENESITKNSPLASLQEKVDNLKFQLLLKDKNITRYKSKATSSDKQAFSLRSEVQKLENKIDEKNAIIHALQQQIDCLKEIGNSNMKQTEIDRLKKKVEELRNIQAILHESAEGVQDIIVNVSNPKVLAQYITCMKKELLKKQEKHKVLNQTIDQLRIEIANHRVKDDKLDEERMKRRELQEKFAICESEKMYFQQKLKDLGLDTSQDQQSEENVPLFSPDSYSSKNIEKFSSKAQTSITSISINDETTGTDYEDADVPSFSYSSKTNEKFSSKAQTSITSISISDEITSTNYGEEDVLLSKEAIEVPTKKSKMDKKITQSYSTTTSRDRTKNQPKLRLIKKENRIEKNSTKRNREESYAGNNVQNQFIDLTNG